MYDFTIIAKEHGRKEYLVKPNNKQAWSWLSENVDSNHVHYYNDNTVSIRRSVINNLYCTLMNNNFKVSILSVVSLS